MTPRRAAEFLPLLDLQPQIIVNDRLGGGFRGDTQTPEQHIPPRGYPGEDWETCMSINDTWGYKSNDTNFKSTATLIRSLVDVASKGGNYLLNVGPTGEGIIPQPEVDRLTAIGDWLKVNGDSIYGSGPTAFGDEAGQFDSKKTDKHGQPIWTAKWDWRCTTKPGKLFIHLFNWPARGFMLKGVAGSVTRAYMLADDLQSGLLVEQQGDQVWVKLPILAPDAIDSVLVLDLAAEK
jgi:alpha-L-fucosidase